MALIKLLNCFTFVLIYFVFVFKSAVALENPWENAPEAPSMWRTADEEPMKLATPDLKEYFSTKCEEFLNLPSTRNVTWIKRKPKCTDLWTKFSGAWLGRAECDVPSHRYDDFLLHASFRVPRNQGTFWSGVWHFIEDCMIGNSKKYIIENTLPGYVLGKARWCGSKWNPTDPATECAGHWRENCSVYSSFASMSIKHARESSGNIVVLLNGGINPGPGATGYSNSSQFAKFEMPNLSKGNLVNGVTAWLLIAKGDPKKESCHPAGPSIKILENQVKKMGYNWTCVENPVELKSFQCNVAKKFH